MNNFNEIQKQFMALGQSQYEIGIINQENGKHMSDLRTIETMEKKIPRYIDMNQRGENLYIRAIPTIPHPVLMLDDLDRAGLDFLAEHFEPAACIVETSADNFQVWYRLPFSVDMKTRKGFERVLIAALVAAGHKADKKSADGGHYGRLASFMNCKPSRAGFIVQIESSSGNILSQDAADYLIEQAARLGIEEMEEKRVKVDANLHDIREHRYSSPSVARDMVWILESLRDTNSPSETEWYIACRLAKRGYCEMDIAKAILDYSPHDIMRKHDPSYYLLLTAKNAIQKTPDKKSPSSGSSPRGRAARVFCSGEGTAGAVTPADTPTKTPFYLRTQPARRKTMKPQTA